MFKWLTRELVRLILKVTFTIALVISFFVNEYQPALVYAVMLILLEVEEINEKINES